MITESTNWKENDAITVKIKRDEQIITDSKIPYEEKEGLKATDATKIKDAWLKS
jgi:hypothetical protein